jgi:hypothetical protein
MNRDPSTSTRPLPIRSGPATRSAIQFEFGFQPGKDFRTVSDVGCALNLRYTIESRRAAAPRTTSSRSRATTVLSPLMGTETVVLAVALRESARGELASLVTFASAATAS